MPLVDWKSLQNLPSETIEVKAREILAQMSLDQKVRQMAGDQTLVRGGIPMLRQYNARPICAGTDPELGIPPIAFSDGPRGVVMGASTCFPVSMARGASWDPELEERIGEAIGIEARAQGANCFGGVCINLLRHPAWGRAQETYGEDPFHLGIMGVALLTGVQKHIMACAKHYALNSIENTRMKVNVRVDERTLREIYVPHFKKCVDAGVASIMGAYNKVNGDQCCESAHLLRDILKRDWAFSGFVISDFVYGVRNGQKAVNAGLDIEMPFRFRMTPRKMKKMVGRGLIPEALIDDAVLRILRQKLRFNRGDDPTRYKLEIVTSPKHISLAREAARKGMVLLKNTGSILPLNRAEVKKIAVIGKLATNPNNGDLGSSRVRPPNVVTPLEGIQKVAGGSVEIEYNPGTDPIQAMDLAKTADVVVIVVGLTQRDEGERVATVGGDRSSLNLRLVDEELILSIARVNPKVIVVLEGGSAIIMEKWKDAVPAILMAWYPGMEGGHAIADVFFGDANPCGKLPCIFPKSLDQLPFFDSAATDIEYGYYHGYRLMDIQGHVPAFPFGFGLSYTSYSYKNLQVTPSSVPKNGQFQVSVDITNTGSRPGEEIVQLYVNYPKTNIDRPVKDLRGFKKIALEPGETKTCTIIVPVSELAFFDVSSMTWSIEGSDYSILVGPSSRDEDLLRSNLQVR
jgi:beta-glucosidase